VKRSATFFFPALLGFFVLMAPSQSSHHFPTPPEPMDPQSRQKTEDTQRSPTRHIDYVQVQKEADDLARTAQTIPADVASSRNGMLPKDVIEKLKQIEKLSKHLRNELNP